MREIKFRCWCVSNKEWEKDRICIHTSGAILHYHKGQEMMVNPKTHILQQYTGLKDKNGKEIYEGDIVKHNGLTRINESLLVEFKDGAFCLTGKKETIFEDVSATIRDLMFQARGANKELELEVIGNTHETPEAK